MSFWYSAKGSRQGVSVYSGPLPVGIQDGIQAPRGNMMKAMRRGSWAAATWPSDVDGSMASRNGRAMVAPTPRNTVRREIWGEVMGFLQSCAFERDHWS